MKIPKIVSIDTEVEVDVTFDDIVSCLVHEVESPAQILQGINNCSKFLKAIPEESVKAMTEGQRALVSKFFLEQSERFSNNKQKET